MGVVTSQFTAVTIHTRAHTHTHRDIERLNLLNMLKIAVKALIDSSMRVGRTLTDEDPQLLQVLILLEHVLRHRLKGGGGRGCGNYKVLQLTSRDI